MRRRGNPLLIIIKISSKVFLITYPFKMRIYYFCSTKRYGYLRDNEREKKMAFPLISLINSLVVFILIGSLNGH